MKKISNFKIAFATFGAFSLAGCVSNSQVPCFGYSPEQPAKLSSANGNINISVDGSASMKGFAAASNSVFHRVIEELDPILSVSSALNMPRSKTTFSRIGREAAPSKKVAIDKLNSLLEARKTSLYEPPKDSKWKNVSSSIAEFAKRDPNSLDVLISDLEPDNASIQQLLTKIKPKLTYDPNRSKSWFASKTAYIGNELAVVGIKSEFDGTVFPTVQGTFSSFRYKGQRPFYVVLLGPADKVELVIKRLSLLNLNPSQWQASRFAANPSYGMTYFADPSKSSILTKNCFYPSASVSMGLAGKLRLESESKWIKLIKSKTCALNEYQIKFGFPTLIGFGPMSSADSDLFKTVSTQISSVHLSQKKSFLTLKEALPIGSLRVIDISAKADQIDPLRWMTWNMNPALPDGSKTQRLLRLISNIRSETDLHSKNAFGSLYSPIRVCAVVKG